MSVGVGTAMLLSVSPVDSWLPQLTVCIFHLFIPAWDIL